MKVNYSGYTKEEVIKRCQFLDDKITSISEENERLKENRDRLQVPLKQRNKELEEALMNIVKWCIKDNDNQYRTKRETYREFIHDVEQAKQLLKGGE